MIADDAFVVNPDYLVAPNAVSSESNPARISDNLVILNQAPAAVRREMLRYIDNLSVKLIQNHAERLNRDGIFAWSQLIADSGEVNPIGQLRAAGAALTFALPQVHLNVSPIVVASFPLVYRELKQGKEGQFVWSIFSRLGSLQNGTQRNSYEFSQIELASIRSPKATVTTDRRFGTNSQYTVER